MNHITSINVSWQMNMSWVSDEWVNRVTSMNVSRTSMSFVYEFHDIHDSYMIYESLLWMCHERVCHSCMNLITYTKESWHTWISRIHVNDSWQTSHRTYTNESWHTREYVAYMWMSHGKRIRGHIRMSHGTHVTKSPTRMSHGTHVDKSRTCEWVMATESQYILGGYGQ